MLQLGLFPTECMLALPRPLLWLSSSPSFPGLSVVVNLLLPFAGDIPPSQAAFSGAPVD